MLTLSEFVAFDGWLDLNHPNLTKTERLEALYLVAWVNRLTTTPGTPTAKEIFRKEYQSSLKDFEGWFHQFQAELFSHN